ncbi:polysaccharide deacetylase family protein [candidate division WOR-3 bacterium]|nr:polysaccharide deacetylase family protein [candidate division WOR-3 bacterium]
MKKRKTLDESYLILLLIPIFYITGWLIWYFRTGGIPYKTPRIISFHKISNKPELGGTFCTNSQFKRFMEFLGKNKYITTNIGKHLENYNDKTVSIFFDDAYEEIYNNAFPIMKTLGFAGVIAPVTGFIGEKNLWDRGGGVFRHMNREQIMILSKNGFDVISHTMTHRDLRKLNDKELLYEMSESKRILESIIKKKVDYILYPYGLYNNRVKCFSKKAGYKGAFASYNKSNRVMDNYAMGRNTMYIIDNVLDLKIIIERKSLLLYGHEETKGRIINWFSRFSEVIKI